VTLEELRTGGEAQTLPAHGTVLLRAPVAAEAKAVRASAPRGTPLYAQLVETGFDRTPPAEALAKGVEVRRELRNAKGEVVSSLSIGEKLDVVVRVRATDGGAHEVALVDLLPGGFEVDLGARGLAERQSLGGAVDAWRPTYVDVREDRVVFYGWIDGTARDFVYRIAPTALGRFSVPPVMAEGLYERAVEARAPGGTIEVRE
jgi:hypothetical protein